MYSMLTMVLGFLVSVKYGSAIMCYDCNSAYDPRCGQEFDPFSLGVVNCSLKDPLDHIDPIESTICRAIKMEIYGKVRVVRQCGYLPDNYSSQQTCRRHTGIGEVFVTYCSCDTDLCNTGYVHSQQMALLCVMFIALLCY